MEEGRDEENNHVCSGLRDASGQKGFINMSTNKYQNIYLKNTYLC